MKAQEKREVTLSIVHTVRGKKKEPTEQKICLLNAPLLREVYSYYGVAISRLKACKLRSWDTQSIAWAGEISKRLIKTDSYVFCSCLSSHA